MFEAMVEELNAAHVSVYPDLFGFRGFTNDTQAEYWFYEQAQLAQSTGGLNFTNDSIWETARAALADFGPYYMLAVAVPTPNKTDWIPLNIEVHRPGVVVRSAEGFFGLKPVKTH
jgi:hypothetical protein